MRLIRSEQLEHSKTCIVLVALEVCASSGRDEPRAFGRVNVSPIRPSIVPEERVDSRASHCNRDCLNKGAIKRSGEFRFTPNQKPTVTLAVSGPLEQKI